MTIAGTSPRTFVETAAFARHVAVEGGRAAFFSGRHVLERTLSGPDEEAQARSLRDYLVRMGPLYMKAGQVLATQSGLFPKHVVDEFRQFFSDLPPMEREDLDRTLARSFGTQLRATFADFDWAPSAVGCIAQVHRARLKGGGDVAVKIVKKNVSERIAGSVWLMQRMLRVAGQLPRWKGKQIAAHFEELRPLVEGQCDMLAEAHRQVETAHAFRGYPHLRIPRPYLEFCRSDVLVMEFMDGTRGQDYARAESPRPLLARRLQEVFQTMVYLHGRFHIDPHPGNILFGPSGEIQLLDFGLVGQLSEEERTELAAYYYACIHRDWIKAVQRFTRAFTVFTNVSSGEDPGYIEEQSRVLRRHYEEESSRWSTMAFFDEANQVLARYGGRFSTKFSLLAVAVLTCEGFLSQVDPHIDLWTNARRFTDRFSPYMSEEIRGRFDQYFGDRIPASMSAKRRASSFLVAPTHLDRYVLPSAFPMVVKRAQGSRLEDIDGNEYVDLSCGFGPHILGYAHPVIVDAMQRAARDGCVNALASEVELRHAERIARAFPDRSKVVMCNSGTESALVAFRLARAFTQKSKIAKFEGHFHGWSDQGMVSSWFRFSGPASSPEPAQGSNGTQPSVVTDTLVLQYGDVRSFERLRMHAHELACVIVEPWPSALGASDAAFLRELYDTCKEASVLLVFDEVVTGFRVAYGGAQHLIGVYPDMTCLGKVIGGGLPCGAVVGRSEIIEMGKTSGDPFEDMDRKAFVGGTMSGNSLTCAAGEAALKYLDEHRHVYGELAEATKKLIDRLRSAATARGVACEVKGGCSIFSISFGYARPSLIRERLTGTNFKATMALAYYMRKHNVYLPELHTMMLTIAHSPHDLDVIVQAFETSLDEMLADGVLEGQPFTTVAGSTKRHELQCAS